MRHVQEVEVEIHRNGDYDYIYPTVTFSAKYVDNSFSYSYGSIDSVHEEWGWDDVEWTWDKALWSEEENEAIEKQCETMVDDILDKYRP